jgi:trehalose 6-phosphate phosphatase
MSRPLFEAMPEIGARITAASHLLVCLDFDGTLTPIVEDPAMAYLSPQIERVLRSLSECDGVTLAIVSGRSRSDLQTRVGLPGVIHAGNHGLEISGKGFVFVEFAAALASVPLHALAADLAARLDTIPGAFVEDKGLTLSVHYRQAARADAKEVEAIVHRALANTHHPFLLSAGDQVYDIRPCVCWNKGTAVRWIVDHLGQQDLLVIYVGDETTDEDAFAAVPDGITVRVGIPAETAAGFHVECPTQVRRFLEWTASLRRQATWSGPSAAAS